MSAVVAHVTPSLIDYDIISPHIERDPDQKFI